eukprot:6211296-Pleurochrysis_carterae.AAC.1
MAAIVGWRRPLSYTCEHARLMPKCRFNFETEHARVGVEAHACTYLISARALKRKQTLANIREGVVPLGHAMGAWPRDIITVCESGNAKHARSVLLIAARAMHD